MFFGQNIHYIAYNILNKKKEKYIIFSLKLRICHLNIVKCCIVIYKHNWFKVYMTCRLLGKISQSRNWVDLST